MNMCVVVITLLIRREMKLRKARQIMKDQFFKEYRAKWSKIFGKMSEKEENKIWELWNYKK